MEGHPFRDAPPTTNKLPSTKIEAGTSRIRNFLAGGLFTLVWNSIVLWIFVSALSSGETFFAVFSGIFVLVGAGLIVYSGYLFLALFNPRIELHVSEDAPTLGGTLDLHWKIAGSASRIRALKIELLGTERATYRRGTDTTTDTHVFARIRIAHTDVPREIADGTGSVVIPAGAVPSFVADHNQIVWAVHIEGDIPWWPDLEDVFAIYVVPTKHRRAQQEVA